MGWTFMHEHPPSADAYFREQLGHRYTVRDSATVNLSEYYAALRDNETGEVSCFVAMIRWERNAFGYKDMDEGMGPGIANCPERILDLLTPLPDCDHGETYCRFCNAQIFRTGPDRWVSRAEPHQVPEVAGPQCYSGYPTSARREDGSPPFHEPGGTPPCSTCWAREWRLRCRSNSAARVQRRHLLRGGAVVRLVGADQYTLPEHIKADPIFTVVRSGRKVLFRHGLADYRFPTSAQWEQATTDRRAAS